MWLARRLVIHSLTACLRSLLMPCAFNPIVCARMPSQKMFSIIHRTKQALPCLLPTKLIEPLDSLVPQSCSKSKQDCSSDTCLDDRRVGTTQDPRSNLIPSLIVGVKGRWPAAPRSTVLAGESPSPFLLGFIICKLIFGSDSLSLVDSQAEWLSPQ